MQITDNLTWEAVYNDGTSLWECDVDGLIIGKYGDIDRSKLIGFSVYETASLLSCRELEKRLEKQAKTLEKVNLSLPVFVTWLHSHIGLALNWNGVDLDGIFKKLLADKDELSRAQQVTLHGSEVEVIKLLRLFLKPTVKVPLKENYRLIWRRRRLQRVIETKPFATIYLIGWQMTLNGQNIQSILYLYPDGTIEMADNKSNLELLDFER